MPKRTTDIVTTYSKGIRNIGEFNGSFRCLEVHEGKVWTGEADGSIALRNAASGAVLNTIEKKPNIFVYCLLCQGFYIWAGLSDGTILIYNPEKIELVCSIKQHAGAVTCLTGSCGRVYSGSSDWRINAWDSRAPELAEEITKKTVVQFMGHQNSVRCLAVDERNLFSGGDDCTIRCWNVDTATELGNPYPITGHKLAITALVTHEVYLFSASNDCTVKVWNIQTGAMAKNLSIHQGPVKCLLKDPVAQRIWSGDSEGVIAVWDALNLTQVSKLLDHSGAFVTSMKLLSRVTALKLWTVGANGIVKVWYSETDAPTPDYTELNRMEEEMQGTIEAMRGTIIQNYQELQRYKTDLSKWQSADEKTKKQLAFVLGRHHQYQQVKLYYSKILEWVAKRRKFAKRYECAEMLERVVLSFTLSNYFRKWNRFLSLTRERKRKVEISQSLQRFTELGTATIYMKKLIEYSSLMRYKRKRRTLATLLQHVSQRTLAAVFFNKWRRWHDGRKLIEKQALISESLTRASDRSFMSIYFQRLLNFTKREEERERRVLAAHTICHVNGRILMRRHFSTWLQWTKLKKKQCFQKKIRDTLDIHSSFRILFRYYSKWLGWTHNKTSKKLVLRIQGEREKMSWLKKALSLPDSVSDDVVRSSLDNVLIRNSKLETELESSKFTNERLQEVNQMFSRTFGGSRLDPTQVKELGHTINLLKAMILNCCNDFKLISEIREREKGESAVNMFEEAYMVIKCYVEDMVKNAHKECLGEQWDLSKDEIRSLAVQNGRAFLHSLKEMVVCYDLMQQKEKDEVVLKTDASQNGAILLELAEVSLQYYSDKRGSISHRKKSLPVTKQLKNLNQRSSISVTSSDHLSVRSDEKRRKSQQDPFRKTDKGLMHNVQTDKKAKSITRTWSSASKSTMSSLSSPISSREPLSRSSSRSSISSHHSSQTAKSPKPLSSPRGRKG